MAKLARLPEADIINGFKGVLDYYVFLGIPCVRKWPRYKPRTPTPQEAQNQSIFATAVDEWNNLSDYVRQGYITMASGSTLSGRDMFIKMYLNAKSILPY
jgi:hypothetical protein